ncbi:isoprenylcysteine carboxylmethyltransferase family protein [uncultured Methanobrevibacter sp.]|uniref:methyltransferase family protein n=1 Tax=uncultured Methanobrevibacter sp. TaxID=253161 RepID=UPI00261D80CB|nr:isoprenylcysteine carboxylmethyltransferase family protein [uncultured Methanobrevibacter sp.]
MNNEEHLPVFGIGPFLVFPILLLSFISLIASIYKKILVFQINELHFPFAIIGIILILAGILIWISAVLKSKITQEIIDNKLVKTGIYSYIRHPIYSAFLFISTGLIFLSQNMLLFFLPIIYWVILTIGMMKTEEKWLLDKFGDEYVEYSKEVNRFIPFFNFFK